MKRFDYSAFFRPREEGESSPPLRKSERGNYAHATSFRLMTGINCVGGMEGGGRPTRIFCPPLPSLPTTHSTLINSDVHRPPRPPARPSFQPRKCKGIRDLAAKGSSQMGKQLHFWPPKKSLRVGTTTTTTTENQRVANCGLGLPAFCRFWPPRGLQVDATFPIKAKNENDQHV